jgi:hypothetical protein
MTTINLQQNSQGEKQNFLAKGGNSGFIFSAGILIVVLLALAGVKYYVPYAAAQNQVLIASIAAENDKLVGLKSLENVVDMQNRIEQIRNNLLILDNKVTRPGISQILDKMSGDLISGVAVSDFKYTEDAISVSFESTNFSDAAKQVASFKQSKNFSDAKLATIERKENVITSTVEMRIK